MKQFIIEVERNFVIRLMSDGSPCPFGLTPKEVNEAIKAGEYVMTNQRAIEVCRKLQKAQALVYAISQVV